MNLAAKLIVRLGLPALAAASLLTSLAPPVGATDAPDFPAGYTGYHTYAEMTTNMQATATAFGRAGTYKIANMFSIGKSFEGRPMWAMKISDHPFKDEAEPEVLVECNMHAREHLTAEQCLYLIHLLTDNYGQATPLGQRVTKIVNTTEIWVVPMLNPDGAMFDISNGQFHSWRKNRQTNPGSTKIGIDLNRNWSYKWGCCGGSGPNPKSSKYRGQYPFEAVEDRVLRDFIVSRRVGGVQQITEALNVHSYGEHVLYPYGYTKDPVPPDMTQDDHDSLVALAKNMATRNGYKAMQGSSMYIYDGDFIDWAYGDQHIFAFTWEMYPKWGCACGGFKPPDSVIAAQTSRNTDAALYLFEQAACPYDAAGLASKYCS